MRQLSRSLGVVAALAMLAITSSCAAVEYADEPDDDDLVFGPDVVVLVDGESERGTIIAENDQRVVLGGLSGTRTILRSEIASVKRGPRPDVATAAPRRLPTLLFSVDTISKADWAEELHQIPATVINVGVLKHVPYVSHAAGAFELNVYGDPRNPAGVELGVYRGDEASHAQLLEAMEGLLREERDRAELRKLPLGEGKVVLDGLTFEVTPPTAEDAFGGWWISVYDERALEASRASEAELNSVATRADDGSIAAAPGPSGWTASDYSYSKKPKRSSNGPVYVRGYTKKNGKYVAPHTRSRSRR